MCTFLVSFIDTNASRRGPPVSRSQACETPITRPTHPETLTQRSGWDLSVQISAPVGDAAAATPGPSLRITADYLLLLGSTWKPSVLSSVLKTAPVFVRSPSHV